MAPSSSRNGATVRLIAIHTAEGARTKADLGRYFDSGVQASSHVGIDSGGVQQYVDYSRAAWTLRSGNPVSDNAELCAFSRWTREQWLGTAPVDGCSNPRQILMNAAGWTRARCEARGIPKVKLSPADVRAGRRGVIGHVDWTLGMNDGTHTDPGGNFPWDVFMALVNGSDHVQPDPVPQRDTTEEEAMIHTIPATAGETCQIVIGRPGAGRVYKMWMSTGFGGEVHGRVFAWAAGPEGQRLRSYLDQFHGGNPLHTNANGELDGAWAFEIPSDNPVYMAIPADVLTLAIEYTATKDIAVSWEPA